MSVRRSVFVDKSDEIELDCCSVIADGFAKSYQNPNSIIPVPHQVRDRLQPESSILKQLEFSWTPAFALRGVVPYPPACKPYGLEAGTESGVTTFCMFIIAIKALRLIPVLDEKSQ